MYIAYIPSWYINTHAFNLNSVWSWISELCMLLLGSLLRHHIWSITYCVYDSVQLVVHFLDIQCFCGCHIIYFSCSNVSWSEAVLGVLYRSSALVTSQSVRIGLWWRVKYWTNNVLLAVKLVKSFIFIWESLLLQTDQGCDCDYRQTSTRTVTTDRPGLGLWLQRDQD